LEEHTTSISEICSFYEGTVKITTFCDMVPCSLVDVFQRNLLSLVSVEGM